MTFKIIDHDGDHQVLAENENGEKLHFNVHDVLNPDPNILGFDTTELNGPTMPLAQLFDFEIGIVLSAHQHNATTLHSIEVLEGTVEVRKDSGNVMVSKGDPIVILQVGETHSIVGITKARTLHELVHQPPRKAIPIPKEIP